MLNDLMIDGFGECWGVLSMILIKQAIIAGVLAINNYASAAVEQFDALNAKMNKFYIPKIPMRIRKSVYKILKSSNYVPLS